jgi:hypothetical protein
MYVVDGVQVVRRSSRLGVVPGWWEQRGSELFKTISRVFSLSRTDDPIT